MSAGSAAEPGTFGTICPNCYAQRAAGARYCHRCGQPGWDRTPTVRQVVREYGAQYVGAEGALWRTLGLLLLRPGRLTVEYLHGRRRRYLHPIRLYLTTSIVCFLLLQLTSALVVDTRTLEPASLGADRELTLDLGAGGVRLMRDGGFECDLAPWLCERLKRRYAVEPQRLMLELQGLQSRFLGYLPYAVFLLVPLFAALMQWAYWRRRMHYAEHLVFALHLHAFWFTALWIAAIAPAAIGGLFQVFVLAYGLLAMHRVYGGRWRYTILRAVAISPVYLAAMGLLTIGVAAIAVVA